MNSPIFTAPTLPALDEGGYLLSVIERLLNSGQPGILSTVDAEGCPHARWMATTSFDEFPHFYALTSPDSEKVAQIATHPMVSWMFSSPDLNLVVNLTGHAHMLLEDAETMKRIWRHIADKSRAYFLGSASGPGFAVIETLVERVECTLPEKNRKYVFDPRLFRPNRKRISTQPRSVCAGNRNCAVCECS